MFAPRANALRNYSASYIPVGLGSLYQACRRLYPDQPNPLQVTAVMKYWLGGSDPLDYISMFRNPGDPNRGISPHWHYVSFGLSDLHGDGRVHDLSGGDSPSGYGFELTFRLKQENETVPPTWPAAIMQALAKYVFQSDNTLCPGDHVSWHCSLDNSESRLQHMLMFEDPQLSTVQTPLGHVTFIQIVGVCAEELEAAQQWNGPSIIELMKTVKGAGGPWLISDMRRGESIFQLDPSIKEAVEQGINADGSNLSGVSAKCIWREKPIHNPGESTSAESELEQTFPKLSIIETEQIKATLKKGLLCSKPVLPPIRSRIFPDQNENPSKKETDDNSKFTESTTLESPELLETRTLESAHLQLNLEAGTLLPLALRGRLKHGRHFTFKSVIDDIAITLVPPSVDGAFVDREHPFASHGPWLQVLLSEEDIEKLLSDLTILSDLEALSLPKTLSYTEKNFSITLVPEDY